MMMVTVSWYYYTVNIEYKNKNKPDFEFYCLRSRRKLVWSSLQHGIISLLALFFFSFSLSLSLKFLICEGYCYSLIHIRVQVIYIFLVRYIGLFLDDHLKFPKFKRREFQAVNQFLLDIHL